MAPAAGSQTIHTDARGRMSLGRPNETFIMSIQPDGAIVLEPAVTMGALEARLLADTDLQARLSRAHRGEGLVRRPAKTRRRKQTQ